MTSYETSTVFLIVFFVIPIQMDFFGAAHEWGGGETKIPPPKNLSHISYNDETWHSYTFLPEISKFCEIKKYRYKLNFVILMMSAKMTTPGLSKNKDILKKIYDVIVFVNTVTNKTLSSDSNYTVDVVIGPKFSTSSIFMR